jgi:ribosomal protein S8
VVAEAVLLPLPFLSQMQFRGEKKKKKKETVRLDSNQVKGRVIKTRSRVSGEEKCEYI